MFVVLSTLLSLALAAAPTTWSMNAKLLIPANQTAVQSAVFYTVPELQDELTVTINNYDGLEYWACLKNGAVAPAVAGTAGWSDANYCFQLHFTNSSTSASFAQPQQQQQQQQRARAVPANLRGVGSAVDALVADAVAVGRAAGVRRRDAVGAGAFVRGSVAVNVPAGNYFLTVVAAAAPAANATLDFTLSGSRCAAQGEFGAACAAVPMLAAGMTFMFTNVGVNQTMRAQLGNYKQINDSTAAVVIAAQVDTVGGVVEIVARAGAFPTAAVNDASLKVTKGAVSTATLLAPRTGPWYFAVVNQNNTVVTANITVTVKQCGAGAFGLDCNTNVTAIGAVGVPASTAVAAQASTYYSFRRAADDAAAATLSIAAALVPAESAKEADDKAPQLTVYSRRNALPTTTTYDYTGCIVAACTPEQQTQIVAADWIDGNANDTWYVLVTPVAAGSLEIWNAAGGACANNCTDAEHGTCNTATAVCQCDVDRYSAFDCSVKLSALERWEWALIIGGAVLVAIGLIGCIVYFIQRQSRRAGFERV